MPIESHRWPTPPAPRAAAATRWSCPATVSTAPRARSTGWSARTRPSAAPAATRGGTRSGPVPSASSAAAYGASSWMSHSAVRPSIERSANSPAPRPWQTSSGRHSHCRPRRSRPASSRHQSSLNTVATELTASPVREGSSAASARSSDAAWRPPRGSCHASSLLTARPPASTRAPVSAIAQNPTERTSHVSPGGAPGRRAAGRRSTTASAGSRSHHSGRGRSHGGGQRRAGDHPTGTVERHRLGHGGPEIDADVDGRGHVLRNLGMPGGSVNDRGHTRSGDFGSGAAERVSFPVAGRPPQGRPCTPRPGGGIGRRASLRC